MGTIHPRNSSHTSRATMLSLAVVLPRAGTMLSLAVVLLCVAGLGQSQTIGFGGCSRKGTVKENFDIVKYMGTWYEYGSIPNTFQSGLKCVSATYTLKDNGMVEVYNKGIKKDGSVDDITGEAKIVGPEDAKLGVRFFSLQPFGPYWVVDTDYDDYTFIWSCSSVGVAHAEFAWIMARAVNPDPAVIAKIMDLGVSMGIAVDKIKVTDQSC